ncbi:MAG: serine/threonine-protein kinase [Phycisphaerales bacterium JB052]
MNDESAQRLAQIIFCDDQEDGDSAFPALPGYELHSVIGQGGGGVVYEGSVKATARPVAVKVLHPRTTSSVSHALNELDRLAAVRSPVVPHVFEHGWLGDKLYIVTELIQGQSPTDYARNRTLKQKVALLASIADAVSTLTARGIIHRDLKPSNIVITPEGNPVILDLGIATIMANTATEGDAPAQRQGHEAVVGTAAYMSPEQAMGRNDEVSTQWDVYALGALGYKILTGSTPHGDTPTVTAALDASASKPIILPRTLNPALPKRLETILLTACAHDPEQRYENPQQLRDDLNRWLNREPIVAGKQSTWSKLLRFSARHPLAMTSTGMLLIVMFMAATLSALVWWQGFLPYRFGTFGTSSKGTVTSLYSRIGRILYTWESREPNGIKFPGRLLKYNNQNYAILGFATPELHGAEGLVAYRVGHYDESAWTATQHIPAELRYAARFTPPPDNFNFMKLEFIDVFPDSPGPELVSTHNYTPNSPSVIQIHRPDGMLLCEYYHDGYISSINFEPTHGIMYAAAENSDGTWQDRGLKELPTAKYPYVVFAFTPKIGDIQQVIQHPGLDYGTPPRWYKCLLPSEAYGTVRKNTVQVGIDFKEAHFSEDRLVGNFEIQLGAGTIPGTDGQVNLIVSPEGEILRSWANDSWTGTEHGWTSDIFTLGDLPPRVVPRKYEPSESLPASPPPPESQTP